MMADGTGELRSRPMLVSAKMTSWVVIYPFRCARDCHGFVTTLCRAAGGMKFVIAQPFTEETADAAGTQSSGCRNGLPRDRETKQKS